MVRNVDRMIRSTHWSGPEANRFKYQWWPGHRAHLSRVSQDLRGLGQSAVNNARAQEDASGAAGAGTGGPSVGGSRSGRFLDWVVDHDIVDGLRVVQSIADFGTDVKAAYFATMVGLTTIGMKIHKGGAAFDYYRSAKGGFTTQYGKLAGKAGTVVTGALNVTDYALNVFQHGVGSSEAAESAFDGTISTGASLVPGGGLAYEGGKAIGDSWYHHTPLGGRLESSITGEMESDLGAIGAASDRALASGNFEEAVRLNDVARAAQERMDAETSGYKGLLNSAVAVLIPFK